MVQFDIKEAFEIATAEAFVFRAPAHPPVRTSFGVMHDRPSLLIRLTDVDGVTGWGEAWCNFPAVGAEHRHRLFTSFFAPLLRGKRFQSPQSCFASLTARSHILALQAGEPGPLSQVIAAIDIAAWDLVAKRASLPLWRLLGGQATVDVYASGIHPDEALQIAKEKSGEGYTAFKLKIGFDKDRDLQALRGLRDMLGTDATLMVDANQAWSPKHARMMLAELSPYNLAWVEEPVPADTPWQTWRSLAEASPVRLAAGENLRGEEAFFASIVEGGIQVVQPDIGKWGGFTGCLQVGRKAIEMGRWFCPHWLGAGIGLTASLHLKAAVGGPGCVEVDANPNQLRSLLGDPDFKVEGGRTTLSDKPGLGVELSLDTAAPYLIPIQQG